VNKSCACAYAYNEQDYLPLPDTMNQVVNDGRYADAVLAAELGVTKRLSRQEYDDIIQAARDFGLLSDDVHNYHDENDYLPLPGTMAQVINTQASDEATMIAGGEGLPQRQRDGTGRFQPQTYVPEPQYGPRSLGGKPLNFEGEDEADKRDKEAAEARMKAVLFPTPKIL
jgi:hypothetical protein